MRLELPIALSANKIDVTRKYLAPFFLGVSLRAVQNGEGVKGGEPIWLSAPFPIGSKTTVVNPPPRACMSLKDVGQRDLGEPSWDVINAAF